MKWQKRKCPIKMELSAIGSGWSDVSLDICGDHHEWSVSGCLGDGVGALVESLYALYPCHVYDQREQSRIKAFDEYVGDFKNGRYVNLRPRGSSDSGFVRFPKRVEFFWDLEGAEVEWTITRESGDAKDFMLNIELKDVDDSESKTYRYDVKYSDFCYAVGKALTQVVKINGFSGFYASVWECDVNVRQLCFLKACGMGKPDAVRPVMSKDDEYGDVSSFEDEIELLIFDM